MKLQHHIIGLIFVNSIVILTHNHNEIQVSEKSENLNISPLLTKNKIVSNGIVEAQLQNNIINESNVFINKIKYQIPKNNINQKKASYTINRHETTL